MTDASPQNVPLTCGPIEDIVLLGGGELLRRICLWAKQENLPIRVVTSPRHAEMIQDGKSLEDFLKDTDTKHFVVKDITDPQAVAFIGPSKPERFFLSLGAAWIFKPEILSRVFGNRLFNIHATRLPQNRGGGGFSWQILTGNRFGFCMLHTIDGNVDTGEIVDYDEFLYPASCRKPIDYNRVCAEKNFQFITAFIHKHRKTQHFLHPFKQTEYLSTYWPRLNTDLNGWIDWSLDAAELEAFICAFDDPYDGAQTTLNGKTVHLKSASLNKQDGLFHSFQSGIVYRKAKDWVCVSAKGCGLIIEGIYDQNGDSLLPSIALGDRLISPPDKIEQSKSRVFYTPSGIKQ